MTVAHYIPERRDTESMQHFYISSPSKKCFCLVEKPTHYLQGAPSEVKIWLLKWGKDMFSVQKQTLLDYIWNHFVNVELENDKFYYRFNIKSLTGKCFLLMFSESTRFIGVFCFDLMHPGIMREHFKGNEIRTLLSLEPFICVNDHKNASEVLLIWNSDLDDRAARDLDGFCILKPNASLKYFAKMNIKEYNGIGEIQQMELPKNLKQCLVE